MGRECEAAGVNSNLPSTQSNRHNRWQELICHAQQWLRRAIQCHKSLWRHWEMDLWDADGAARDLSERCPKGNTKREISHSHYLGSLTYRVLQVVHWSVADKCHICHIYLFKFWCLMFGWQKSHWGLCHHSFECIIGFVSPQLLLATQAFQYLLVLLMNLTRWYNNTDRKGNQIHQSHYQFVYAFIMTCNGAHVLFFVT